MAERVTVVVLTGSVDFTGGELVRDARDCGELPSREALLWCAAVVQDLADEDAHTARVVADSPRFNGPDKQRLVEDSTKDARENEAVADLLRRLAGEG